MATITHYTTPPHLPWKVDGIKIHYNGSPQQAMMARHHLRTKLQKFNRHLRDNSPASKKARTSLNPSPADGIHM